MKVYCGVLGKNIFLCTATRDCKKLLFKSERLLRVSILYTVRAIARPEQASHEDGAPYPGTNRFLTRCNFKTRHVRWGVVAFLSGEQDRNGDMDATQGDLKWTIWPISEQPFILQSNSCFPQILNQFK